MTELYEMFTAFSMFTVSIMWGTIVAVTTARAVCNAKI